MHEMRVALLGDVMLGRGVGVEIERGDPAGFWGDTLDILRAADLVICNLECAVTRHPRPWMRTPKAFHFRAPPAAVEVLRAARVRAVNLANNHILDFEEEGLRETLERLDGAGIARVGAGNNAAEAARPAVIETVGRRVAFVGVTDNEPGWRAGPNRPGTHYVDIDADEQAVSVVEGAVRACRAAGADTIILSIHWGPNMVLRPSDRFRSFAHAAVGMGVDLIHGHSAHVFQGIEIVNGRAVLYDTGDFLDDYVVDPDLRNDWSFIFEIEFADDLPRAMHLTPVQLGYAGVRIARGALADAICARMQSLSTEFGTMLKRSADGLDLDVR